MSAAQAHVLMTADAVGGVWTYALDLGRGLVDAGVRVTLAALGPAPDAAQSTRARAVGLEVVAVGGALDWTAIDEGEVAASASALRELINRLRPDVLHLNSPALAAFGSFPAPVLAACHSCVATWWAAVKGDEPLPADLAWRASLTAQGYATADALLAPSHAFAAATRAAYGLARRPYLVPNGRNPPSPSRGGSGWGEASGKSAAAETSPYPDPPLRGEGEIVVLTAGRIWDEGKDVATLDRAASRLSGVDVCAAGPPSGPNGQAVSFSALRLLGLLDAAALADHLRTRPIFVSPSLYEPFGLAVLEAAQAGCPLVLSDIETFRELWDGAAVFFPAGDDAALADRLADLAADPDRCSALGEAARKRAARYTVEAMAVATLRLYATLSPAFAGRAHVEAAA